MVGQISPWAILSVVFIYFIVLFLVSYYTGKDKSNESFFLSNRKAPWYLIAYGMLGASISGVTFISVPGKVGTSGLNMCFSYMQVVFGYLLGYAVIAFVLMPIYYRMNLVTIYGYLEERFGFLAYKSGAALFLISRTIGSSLRLFLMIMVLQKFALEPLGIPIWITAFITIFLIWFYTHKGGNKTILYTDVLLTTCFLLALIITIFTIGNILDKNVFEMFSMAWNSDYSKMIFWEGGWSNPNFFLKQFISGALITIVMTGLDQDLMQKNLSCRNIRDAQKNMITFSIILVFVNILFLTLGAFLYLFASQVGIEIPANSDLMYPTIAFKYLPSFSALVFIIGIVASTFASTDSALTALTTSFCVDFLDFNKKTAVIPEYDTALREHVAQEQYGQRSKVHAGMAITLFILVLIINLLNNDAIINNLFKAAGLTYGPLLGLFAFGISTKKEINSKLIPYICIIAPIITFIIDKNSSTWFGGYKFGFETLLLNGMLVYGTLFLTSPKKQTA